MEIPLFPLHTVLCPGIVLPLHIFEERYRAMTRHCLETGAPFGVVLIRDGREVGNARGALALAGVGGPRRDPQSRPLPGRPLRPPGGRHRTVRHPHGRPVRAPYLVAEVTPLEDDVGDEPRAERLSAAAIRQFVRYLELMRARDGKTGDALDIQVEFDGRRGREATDDALPMRGRDETLGDFRGASDDEPRRRPPR